MNVIFQQHIIKSSYLFFNSNFKMKMKILVIHMTITFLLPFYLQICIKSCVWYWNISRSIWKCLVSLTNSEHGTSLKNSYRWSGVGPPAVWWIHFESSLELTKVLRFVKETKASSSPVPSNFIMALYGMTHGAHCWLNKMKNKIKYVH